jgi:hypothetical protein
MALRTFLICIALLGTAACAPGMATHPPAKKAHVPIYTCDGSRISQSKHCRQVGAVSRSSSTIVPQSNLPRRSINK